MSAGAKTAENGGLKKAIITGITGQDGSYLAEFLLEKVRWVLEVRRLATYNRSRRTGNGGIAL